MGGGGGWGWGVGVGGAALCGWYLQEGGTGDELALGN